MTKSKLWRVSLIIMVTFAAARAIPIAAQGKVERRGASNSLVATFTTVQGCADVVQPGETCLVYPGKYPEYVQTKRGGVAGSRLTFKAHGVATIEGIRVRYPYIVVDGFDITKYPVGNRPAHITIEQGASHCEIVNNTIRDGVQLLSGSFYFKAPTLNNPTQTITHAGGGFLNAGFRPGTNIYIASNINSEIGNANLVRQVIAVTDTTLTIDPSQPIVTEGPVRSLLYATRSGKNGVQGITVVYSSSGYPSYCRISNNRLRNLGGSAISVAGSHHLIEHNLLEQMNGWQIFNLLGHHNVIRFNHIRNSPRYDGFEPPDGTGPDQSEGGHWDFVAQTFRSFGSPSMEGHTNYIEFNLIENIDNELFNITEKSAQFDKEQGKLIYVGLPSKHFVFRHNVISGLEMHGAIHRPDAVIQNNTFHNSNPGRGAIFAVSTGYPPREVGSAEGATIINNAFVGNGEPDPNGRRGWYHVENVTNFTADYNFVAGAAINGFPSKLNFVGKEANGINGGDPLFLNISNITGDGKIFNGNDGLQPRSALSPLVDRGRWPSTIVSSSGSGSSFRVANAAYFRPPIAGTEGDSIQLEGQTQHLRILAIDFNTHTISIEGSVSWTRGLGVARRYTGARPDIGAYELGVLPGETGVSTPAVPGNLRVAPLP